jgi:hypothetical protein
MQESISATQVNSRGYREERETTDTDRERNLRYRRQIGYGERKDNQDARAIVEYLRGRPNEPLTKAHVRKALGLGDVQMRVALEAVTRMDARVGEDDGELCYTPKEGEE